MSQIKILDALTANQIAAGEVVERPASVVKELCENAIDAKATRIQVELRQGGIESITVTDDGQGMDKEDLVLAFEPHATSKIREIQDLLQLQTKGFRGEALASIASISKIYAKSKTPTQDLAYELQLEAGSLTHFQESSPIQGTQIVVKDLFYNTPARYKFLKKDSTEVDKVREVVLRLALSHPHIAFTLISNHKTLLSSPGNKSYEDTIYALLGAKFLNDLISLSETEEGGIKVFGFVGQPEAAKRSRASQYFFVNQRFIKSQTLSAALDQVYQHRLMKGLYPPCLLFVEVQGDLVDVNVHPQKLEVRFSDSNKVFRMVLHAIEEALEHQLRPPHQSTEKAYQIYQDLYQNFFEKEKEVQVLKETPKSYDYSFSDTFQLPPKVETSLKATFEEEAPVILLPSASEISAELPAFFTEETKTEILEEKPLSKAAHEREFLSKQSSYLNLPISPLKADGQVKLSHLKYIGSAFNTFLIFEDEKTLWWVDQHAAHEKIIFEKLYKSYQNEKHLPLQNLLVPLEIYLSKQELLSLEKEKINLEAMGITFDFFSEESILLRQVPYLPEAYLPKEIFLDALQFLNLQEKEENKKATDAFFYDYLAEISCKAAIKGNQSLSLLEVKQLIEDLEALDQAHHCPHGRPLIIQMPKQELERRFKRIV